MRMRWAVATVGALALALLTLNVDLPWTFHRADASAKTTPQAPATFSCPANAKAANLNFTLKDLIGRDVRLASLKGKVIVVDFWATWCGPCKIEIPAFVDLYSRYKAQGLEIVGIVVEDPFTKAGPFAKEFNMNYAVLDGNDRTDVEDAFGPLWGLPTTFIINRDGKICSKHSGMAPKSVFENEIKSLL